MLNTQFDQNALFAPSILTGRMFYPMTNVIQNYAWGSSTSLNQLFGIDNPTGEPQAELWMGAHPNGCSTVSQNEITTSLSDLIGQDLPLFLSKKVAQQFGELPFLFKILCAEKALSVQVHPNKLQAELGYAREEREGIPLSASNRNYKDTNHKPELVYALTEYQAMNGFRSICEILDYFQALAIPALNPLVSALSSVQTPQELADFFTGLLSLEGKEKEQALSALLRRTAGSTEPAFALINRLAKQYPGDVGLFAPLMLNVITLKPGEAMYLDAETPHAYIHGTGLEIMANSDNVLRAGLTPKFMDIDELVACTRFSEKPKESLLLSPIEDNGILDYPIPVDDFSFAIIEQSNGRKMHTEVAEILLPLDQPMLLTHANGESCVIQKGQSVYIPAYTNTYFIECQGRVARAYS